MRAPCEIKFKGLVCPQNAQKIDPIFWNISPALFLQNISMEYNWSLACFSPLLTFFRGIRIALWIFTSTDWQGFHALNYKIFNSPSKKIVRPTENWKEKKVHPWKLYWCILITVHWHSATTAYILKLDDVPKKQPDGWHQRSWGWGDNTSLIPSTSGDGYNQRCFQFERILRVLLV